VRRASSTASTSGLDPDGGRLELLENGLWEEKLDDMAVRKWAVELDPHVSRDIHRTEDSVALQL
jgi:hypothetical protein